MRSGSIMSEHIPTLQIGSRPLMVVQFPIVRKIGFPKTATPIRVVVSRLANRSGISSWFSFSQTYHFNLLEPEVVPTQLGAEPFCKQWRLLMQKGDAADLQPRRRRIDVGPLGCGVGSFVPTLRIGAFRKPPGYSFSCVLGAAIAALNCAPGGQRRPAKCASRRN